MSNILLYIGQQKKFAFQFRDANNALITPTAGTIKIYDTDGNVVLASTSLTITGNTASYLHTPAAAGDFVAYFAVDIPGAKPMKRVDFRVVASDGVSQ